MRDLREERGMTQTDLSREVTKLGVPMSQVAINDIETRKTKRIALDTVVAISAALDASPEELYKSRLTFDEESELTQAGLNDGGEAWIRVWKTRRLREHKSDTNNKE
jgi:transcriptional regulator with XRE-family HTH domain